MLCLGRAHLERRFVPLGRTIGYNNSLARGGYSYGLRSARGKVCLNGPGDGKHRAGVQPLEQMVYASVPAKFAPRFLYKKSLNSESYADGTARVMPLGLRIVEDILREHYPPEDVVLCHPENLEKFVGPRTRVVGVAAHNPIGVAFSTGVYSNIFGSTATPINSYESTR